eukprot:gnl/TRDRNA2_/TRDRNA2_67453_c0_seq1.p1 gnl/TRDRNA2_/TRDRNA2_67453_c0~~gnl/TRDRNA2_/TRDRNA2_67453_c0_seq1.p1  ORF type:complete len:332 (+),score=25.29 gnl/TRDRNA2_/TRDRNA2_67453_c0_seq1:152-1147(+)
MSWMENVCFLRTCRLLGVLCKLLILVVLIMETKDVLNQKDDGFFVGTLADMSEMAWVVATGLLASRLAADREALKLSRALSLQSIGSFTIVFGAKAIYPLSWRWNVRPLSDWFCFAFLSAVWLVAWAFKRHERSTGRNSWGESEGFGHEIIAMFAPISAARGSCVVQFLMLCVFFVPTLILGGLLYWFEPKSIARNDVEDMLPLPFLSFVLQVLDMLGMIPQFWLMQTNRGHDVANGDVEEGKRVVAPVLAEWIVWVALCRLLSSLDGVWAIAVSDPNDIHLPVEIFYSIGNVVNFLVLSDFVYYYLRAKCAGKQATVLPMVHARKSSTSQ